VSDFFRSCDLIINLFIEVTRNTCSWLFDHVLENLMIYSIDLFFFFLVFLFQFRCQRDNNDVMIYTCIICVYKIKQIR
jgi:hypothetical protein